MSTTALDGDHVLRQVYDPASESLKTLITANISGAQEVIISDLDDSIKIGNGAGVYMAVNPDGSINTSGSSTVTGDVNLNGLTAMQTTQYTVGTSAVQLTPTPLANRSSINIKVSLTSNTEVVYIGNSSGVTTSTGFALFNGDSIQLDITDATPLYAIGSASGQKVYCLELGD